MAEWNPRADRLALLQTVSQILVEYADYTPLTIRQIFYRLVGAHGYGKDERSYKNLAEMLNRARRARLISFDDIRDDDASITTSIGWDSGQELLERWRFQAENFLLDRQQGQQRRLIVMVEAAGMKPQLETVATPYGVPVIASGGFDSLTAKYKLATTIGRSGSVIEILHIGDHDPSGEAIFTSLAADVDAFIEDLELPGLAHFSRIAVTEAQVRELALPTAPPKAGDNRAFSGETTQAEAIPPDVLAQILEDAITDRISKTIYASALKREEAERERLTAAIERLIEDEGGEP